jgi:apolipoprotein N-acyltransferase
MQLQDLSNIVMARYGWHAIKKQSRQTQPKPCCTSPRFAKIGLYRFHIAAFILGLIHTQAFAPLNLWWLQLLALAGLFYLIHHVSNQKQAAYLGYVFGLGWFSSGFWWLYISMYVYGGMPAVLAGLAVLLLAAALAVFPALALWSSHILCITQHNFQKRTQHTLAANTPKSTHIQPYQATHPTETEGIARCLSQHEISTSNEALLGRVRFWLGMLLTASLWGISEWLRGTVFTGFPWIASGYAHTDGPLSGYAAFVGVYGVSAIAAWLALLLSYLPALRLLALHKSHKWLAITCISLIGVTLSVGWKLQAVRFTEPLPQAISVRLIQGNIPQEMKFDIANFYLAMQRYAALVTRAPADLIIAPETSFPVRLSDLPADLMARLNDFARTSQSQVLFGAISLNAQGQPQNSLVTLDGYEYSKSHLVPFGEFTPIGFDWFMRWLHMPLGNFSRGAAGQSPLWIGGTLLAPNICYEDLFGEEIAHNLSLHPANILVNASNIAWFGDTRALDQHLQIARFRSLETQLPTLRATNTGMTAWIDGYGQVRAALPRLTVGSLDIQVHGQNGITPFVRWGNMPLLISSLLLAVVMLMLTIAYRKR